MNRKEKISNYIYTISDKCYIQGTVEGNDIDLKLLNTFLKSDIQISGNSSFRLGWKGIIEKPHIKGELQIRNSEIQLTPETMPISAIHATATFQDSLFQLKDVSGKIQEMPIA